jgi:KipI family sensor histidine kinase inhibitor
MTAIPDAELTITPLSESALLVRLGAGDEIAREIVDRVVELTGRLDAARPDAVIDIVPAYTTILVEFDPVVAAHGEIERWVREIADGASGAQARESRIVIIPVLYGGEMGPDLDSTAAELGLEPADIVKRHAGGEYFVACMGFSPGWAYLLGLDPALTVPRLPAPRTKVPPGSVAIGGGQTGVYPLETPGGWRLIGRTPLKMFDPARDEPFLLKQGDTVRFAEIDPARFAALAE